MDERILAILKAVANVDYATAGDNDDPYCLFCASDTPSGNPKDVDDPHESACPVVLARRILAEQGTPLKVWRVEVLIRSISLTRRSRRLSTGQSTPKRPCAPGFLGMIVVCV